MKFNYRYDGFGFYCGEIYANSKAEAKTQYREEHGLKRLPNGFELWI